MAERYHWAVKGSGRVKHTGRREHCFDCWLRPGKPSRVPERPAMDEGGFLAGLTGDTRGQARPGRGGR